MRKQREKVSIAHMPLSSRLRTGLMHLEPVLVRICNSEFLSNGVANGGHNCRVVNEHRLDRVIDEAHFQAAGFLLEQNLGLGNS